MENFRITRTVYTEKGAITMTPEEAIELLKGMQSPLEDHAELVGAPAFAYGHKYVYPYPQDYAIEEAIEALKEIQKYREIGTVEECREAVEKRKPKKPKDSLKINPVIDGNGTYVDADMTVYLLCPNCGEMIGIDESCDKFCRECGQAIDENLEGMEDEQP